MQNCNVKILSAKSCEEVENKIDEIDTDCDLIVLHMFSNYVRNLDPEKYVKVHDDLISKLQSNASLLSLSSHYHCIQSKILLYMYMKN